MKDYRMPSFRFLKKFWPFFVIFGVVTIFFWKVFFLGQITLPADLIVGAYFPWLDYKWGQVVGVLVKNPIISDVVSVIYPLKALAINILKNGELPLWNPLMLGGYPLLANFQIGLFSPTTFFFFLFPTLTAWTMQTITQPIMAAVFMYALLRNFKISKLGSITGSLGFAFAGFNIIWLEWNAHAFVAAFIPLLLLFTYKFFKTNRLIFGIGISATLGLQIFSGYPQIVIYTLFFTVLLVLFERQTLNLKNILGLLLFLGLGIAITFIQLIPAFELLSMSQRSYEKLSEDLVYLPWRNVISFIAPDYFGNHTTGNFWGTGNYTNNAGYTGLIIFVLATLGTLSFWKKREVKFFVIIIIVSLLIALPNPISRLVSENAFLGSGAASNTRILVFVNLGLATLAAFGIDALTKRQTKASLLAVLIPYILVLAFGLGSIVRPHEFSSVALRNLVLPSLLLVFISTSLIVIHKSKTKRLALVVLIATVAIAELLRFGWKYTPFSPPEYVFPETPVISFLKSQQKPFRLIPGNVIPMNMWVPYNLESPSGYDAVYPARWSKFLAAGNTGQLSGGPMGRYGIVRNVNSSFFNLANSKYLLNLDPSKNNLSDNFILVFEDKSVRVFENTDALPRAFFVSNWERKDDDEVLKALLEPNFPFKEKIIIEETFREFKPSNLISEPKVEYQNYDTQKSKIKVEVDNDGFLFTSDVWYPGWKVFVDKEEKTIIRANYVFRAVPISKGSHEIEFIYDPQSFKIGKWISISTTMFLLGLLIYETKIQNGRRTS